MNVVNPGESDPLNHTFQGVNIRETLEAAVETAEYGTAKAPNVGRGIAIGDRPPGGGHSHLAVTLDPDGAAQLSTPIFEQGTGSYTLEMQVIGEELGLTADRMHMAIWNTGKVEFDSGVGGSRVTRIGTQVAYAAAQEVKGELLQAASETLGVPTDRLAFTDGAVRNRSTGESYPWPELLQRTGRSITGQAEFQDTALPPVTAYVAQIAEVSVDPETGQVKLLRLSTAHDVGQIVNPIGHQGQVNGGAMQGIGYALMEELQVEDGRVTTLSFGDYKIPTINDLPGDAHRARGVRERRRPLQRKEHRRERRHPRGGGHRQRRRGRRRRPHQGPAHHRGKGLPCAEGKARMIKAFRLHNFKAFEDSGLIELKPITVLAGANSGGKSSILQSLLLLKQTLEAPPDIELSLDGKYLQYSSFSDVVYGKPTLSAAQLTFSFYLESRVNLNRWARFFPGVAYLENERGDVDSHVSLSFGYRRQTGGASIGKVALQRFEVSSAIQGFDGPSLTGTWVRNGSRVTAVERGVPRPKEFRNRRIADITGQHFLPNALVFHTDEEEQGARPYLPLHASFTAPFRDLQRELKDNLQYLGPLRERPQRAYLHSGNPMTEIGRKWAIMRLKYCGWRRTSR